MTKEWLRGARQRSSFGDVAETNISLILAQLNDFDAFQTNHERELVSNCLRLVTESLHEIVKRPGDIVNNLGNGKYIILLPNTDREGAQTVAEKIQENLNQLKIPHFYSNISEYQSFSIGIANGIPTQGLPPDILLETAQNALDEALQNNKIDQIAIGYI